MHLRTLYSCLVEPEIAEKSGISDPSLLSMFVERQEPSRMAGHTARKASFSQGLNLVIDVKLKYCTKELE